MNALQDIQNAAQTIVEQLADRQIQNMKTLYNGYAEWRATPGNAVIEWNKECISSTVNKYIYLTYHKVWNQELNQYVLPTDYSDDKAYSAFKFNKMLVEIRSTIMMMRDMNWEEKYRTLFVSQNMVKLNRALSKHLNDQMSASDIKVVVGGDGAEVSAEVDGKRFVTFGVLCGGAVQCLHYRYRSSLK
jgi:hypothetical protein